eukprot:2089022-Pleurochrysis_carterae.AAC.3
MYITRCNPNFVRSTLPDASICASTPARACACVWQAEAARKRESAAKAEAERLAKEEKRRADALRDADRAAVEPKRMFEPQVVRSGLRGWVHGCAGRWKLNIWMPYEASTFGGEAYGFKYLDTRGRGQSRLVRAVSLRCFERKHKHARVYACAAVGACLHAGVQCIRVPVRIRVQIDSAAREPTAWSVRVMITLCMMLHAYVPSFTFSSQFLVQRKADTCSQCA